MTDSMERGGEVTRTLTAQGESIAFSKYIFLWVVENHASRGNDPEWELENLGYRLHSTDTRFDTIARIARHYTAMFAYAYRFCMTAPVGTVHNDPIIYAAEYIGYHEWTPWQSDVDAILHQF